MPSAPHLICLLSTIAALGAYGTKAAEEDTSNTWPQWRGPLMTGVAPSADPPIEWNENKNIAWKSAIPGLGHSTPVIWSNHIFLTTAVRIGDPLDKPIRDDSPGSHDNLEVSSRYRFAVLSIDRATGKIVWDRTVREALPHEGGHDSGSLASNSPATDGKHVFAFFGSRGLHALDFNGKVVWQRDLGAMHSKHGHGEGSSPVLYGDTIAVNWDHEGQSFVVAFDKSTGKERWRKEREELTSWASPIVVEHEGKAQLIVSGTRRIRAYNLANGDVIWEAGGLSANVVASPVSGNGIVIAGSSYEKQAMFALRLDGASGDISDSRNVLWSRNRSTPYVPSPLLYGDVVYFLRQYQNILSRVNIETGEDAGGPFRLGELRNIYSSPVGAAGRIYVTSREGWTLILSHSAEPALIGINHLDDTFSASAALVAKELYLRGEKFLYRLEKGA